MQIKRKRIIMVLLVVTILFAVSFIGCGKKQNLSDSFDENAVKEDAKTVITLINEEDYTTLENDYWNAMMKQELSANNMQENFKPIIDELGTFESFEKSAVTGSKDEDTEQVYAVAVIIAKYEERKVQYTISFTTDMKVAGVYIK